LNRTSFIITTTICTLLGAILFAYMHGWIIVQYPAAAYTADYTTQLPGRKKNITFSYWHNGSWHTEKQELMCPADLSEYISYLVNSWLTLLDEEHVMDTKVTLQTALLANGNSDVYLSFDRNPLPQEQATHTCWMWVEGLLKTLRDNDVPVHNVHFLVHHQPLQDQHLDFTNAWPIVGFLKG
jgi:hypothetical protein